MHYILFNPLSNGGRGPKKLDKLTRQFPSHILKSLLEIEDVYLFINQLSDDDIVILVGGDGTINQVANRLADFKISCKVFLYRSGTGNDFFRNFKKESKRGLIEIDNKIVNLPLVTINQKEYRFINGTGLGVDGMICHLVNSSSKKKNSFNYYKCCFKAFKTYQPQNIEVIVDGQPHQFKKVWLATIMHGKYFGGGMKIAPKRERTSDDLQVVIVNKVGLFILFSILPTIYLGYHRIFKKFVHFLNGKEITIKLDKPTFLQLDGEVHLDVQKITARR